MSRNEQIITEPIINAILKLWSQSGRHLQMKMVSNSMIPLICQGNELLIELNPKTIRLGDILIYRHNNLLIAHRLIKSYDVEGKSFLILKGDRVRHSDSPLPAEKVIGRVIGVKHFLGYANYISIRWRVINVSVFLLSKSVSEISYLLIKLKQHKSKYDQKTFKKS